MKENKAQAKEKMKKIESKIRRKSQVREGKIFLLILTPPDFSGLFYFLSSLILLNWKLFPFSVLITRHLIWCSSVFFHQRKYTKKKVFLSLPFLSVLLLIGFPPTNNTEEQEDGVHIQYQHNISKNELEQRICSICKEFMKVFPSNFAVFCVFLVLLLFVEENFLK